MNHLSKFTLVFLFGNVSLFAQPMPSDPDWRMFHHDIYHTGLSPLQGNMDTCYVMWACTLAESFYQPGAPVSIGDVDGDGILEAVVLGESDGLYVINGNDGSVQWSDTAYGGWSMPLIEDINGDETEEIIFCNHRDSTLYALNGEDESILWEYKTSYRAWGNPVCGEVDEDGKLEVFFGSLDGKVHALNGEDGSFIWSYTTGGIIELADPALGDIDNDGKLEVVFGSNDNCVYALNGEDGFFIWSYTTSSAIWSPPTLADIDNDDSLEVVFGSRDYNVYALEGDDGSFKWSYTAGDAIFGSPAVGDIDEDGLLEVVVVSDDNKVYALNGEDGSYIWSFEAVSSFKSSPVLADIDGDGKLEVVFGSIHSMDENPGVVYALNGEDGSLLWEFVPAGDGIWYSTPSLADIDNDGKLEVVFGNYVGEPCIVYALNGEESGIKEERITGLFYLSPADPNPFTTKTTVRYELEKAVNIDISVYNMLGQKVKNLFSGKQSYGIHSVSWDGRGESGEVLSSGIYFVRVKAGDKNASRQVMFVR